MAGGRATAASDGVVDERGSVGATARPSAPTAGAISGLAATSAPSPPPTSNYYEPPLHSAYAHAAAKFCLYNSVGYRCVIRREFWLEDWRKDDKLVKVRVKSSKYQ